MIPFPRSKMRLRALPPLFAFLLWFLSGGGWVVPAGAAGAPDAISPGSRVLFFGDSITFSGEYGRLAKQWLEERSPGRKLVFTARGRHGDTARGSLGRVVPEIVPWRPDWVFVNFGINDAGKVEPADFLRDYRELLDAITRETGARPAIVSPVYPDRDTPNPRLEAYTVGLRALARERGLLYVPVYETMRDIRPHLPAGVAYAPDGVHPNPLGCAIFATALLDAIGCPPAEGSVELTLPDIRLTRGRKPLPEPVAFTLPLSTPLRVRSRAFRPEEIAVPRLASPPTLDGNPEEWAAATPSLRLRAAEHLLLGIPSGEHPAPEADLWLGYDDEAFYLVVRVRDAVIRHEPGDGIVNRDGVEIFLDLRPDASAPTAYNARTRHVVQFMPGARSRPGQPVETGNGDAALAEGAQAVARMVPGGYEMEFRLPARHFPGGVIAAPFGFDFSVNDVDASGSFHSVLQLRRSGSGSSSFHTAGWGRAVPEVRKE